MHIRNLIVLTLTVAAFFSCRKQELREARFSGSWKMTRIIRTVYSGETKVSSSETDYNAMFYFTDRGNTFAENDVYFDLDSATAVYPEFMAELFNNLPPPAHDKVFWNVGTDDAHRLSFVNENGLYSGAATVTIKKTAGRIRSWHYYILGPNGAMTHEEYIMQRQ